MSNESFFFDPNITTFVKNSSLYNISYYDPYELFCYEKTVGRFKTIECDYPFSHYLEGILYRSFFGYFFAVFELLTVVLFWFCNIWIEKDFTEAFLSCVGLGLSACTFTKIGSMAIDFLKPQEQVLYPLLSRLYEMCATAAEMAICFGMPVYLLMAIYMSAKRRQFYSCCTWIPYFLILCLSGTISYFYFAPDLIDPTRLVVVFLPPTLTFVLTFGLIGLGLFCFVCCSGNAGVHRFDVVVFDARSRLGWACLYAFAAHLPALAALWCFISLYLFVDRESFRAVYSNQMTQRVWHYLFPWLTLALAFMILPSYREVVLCGCRKKKFVAPVMMYPQAVAPAPTPAVPEKKGKRPTSEQALPTAPPPYPEKQGVAIVA